MVSRSDQEKRLLQMLNSHGNANKCGECSATYPTWASWNLGVFLCGRCASVHRNLGSDVSQVKSLSLDTWSTGELDCLESIGNRNSHKLWNNKKAPFPYDDDDKDAITLFLKEKYIDGKYRTTPIDEQDYNLDGYSGGRKSGLFSRSRGSSQSTSSSRYDRPSSSRTYSSSSTSTRRGGRLEHRPVSSSERKRYGDRARKLKFDYGYEDETLSIEALVLAHGDIKQALELLRNEPKEENPPPLPRRRPTAGALLDPSKTGANNFDWLSGDAQPQQEAPQTASSQADDTQIYQYVDSNTGAVYYIDSNGQQYVDPSQQQQQLLLQQQQMLQMQQPQQSGMDKSTLMSLYSQPTAATGLSTGAPSLITGGTTSSGAPSLNELQMHQQMLQQQQMMQLQQQQQMQMMGMQQQQPVMMGGMQTGVFGQQQPQQGQQPQGNYFTGF